MSQVQVARICRRCGGVGQHRHHVIPRSLGGTNGPTIFLCVRCHADAHSGEADILSLLNTQEQADCVLVAGSIERAREIITRANRREDSIPSPAYARGA